MSLFDRDRLSAGEDEKVLEMDSDNGRTAAWVHLKPLNCTLKKRLRP